MGKGRIDMNKLISKPKGRGGFTLVEMLIVVAIIAILVAVSIPMVGNVLERVRQATDAANERSALALASVLFLTEDIHLAPNDSLPTSTNNAYFFDAGSGTLSLWDGDSSDGKTYPQYGKCAEHKDKCLWVQVLENGTVRMAWATKLVGTGFNEWYTWGTGLCCEHISSGR